MSQIYIMRKALYIAETMLVAGNGASMYFKSIYISSTHNNALTVSLAVTGGASFSSVGDYLIYDYSLAAGAYLKLEDISIPITHQLRGSCSVDLVVSVVGSGILE